MRGWSSESFVTTPRVELALPRLEAHLVVRVSDAPIRLGEAALPMGHAVALVGRTTAWVRHVGAGPSCSSGVSLLPWELEAVTGVPAGALGGAHVRLDALGLDEGALRSRAAAGALERWVQALVLHLEVPPVVPHLFHALRAGAKVGPLVARVGHSHRHLSVLFQRWVGLGLHQVAALGRFERAVEALQRDVALTQVALHAGYADQAHLTRDVRARTGLTPAALRALRPFEPGHVPVGQLPSRRPAATVGRKRP